MGRRVDELTVVIPTLGGDCLEKTIKQLNCGTVVPKEVLICIPYEFAIRIENLSYRNVRIIKTKCRGQVSQRAEGFLQTMSPMVLQLDDDIQLRSEAVVNLMSALKALGRNNVVGPVYLDTQTEKSIHRVGKGARFFLKNVFYCAFYGARWGSSRMGTFTSAGIGFGVDPVCLKVDKFSTEWLPGGCVLSYRDDLVVDSFFPYIGKAFCEDFIHSHLRVNKGIKHWVIPAAECQIERPESESTRNDMVASINARRYFVNISRRSLTRLRVYELISWIRWILKQTF
jgi:hypothetical protein